MSLEKNAMLNKVERKGNRFKLSGNLPNLVQGSFEDKLVKNEGDKVSDNDLAKYGYYQCCRKGLKPESPNQDNFLLFEFEQWKIFGVMDGHGPYGHDASDYVARHLPLIILECCYKDENKDVTKIIKESYIKVHEDMQNYCNQTNEFDIALSGTTCTLCVLDTKRKKFWMSHVGDSKSILCFSDTGKHKAKELTIDHKPTLPIEKKRILQSGGEVRKLEGDIPHRVFVKGRAFPGLAMSRAIGDLIANSVGVSNEPEIAEFEIQPNYEYIIMCSDGVWEFINPKTVCATVYQNEKDLKKACIELAQQSWKRWLHNEINVVDDITVMIYDLKVLKDD